MRFRKMAFVCVVGFWPMVAPVGAQYNPPGSMISGDELVSEEALRKSLEAARWRWGILRVEPWAGLSDASFVRTQDDAAGTAQDDFTATVGAGVRGYAKTGRRLVWATHALPEYTWWREDDAKTGLNGRYGLGLFAFFNRLDLEASARRDQRQGFFSPEVQDLTTTRDDVVRAAAALSLTRRVVLHASHARSRTENREDGSPVFPLLDRDSEETRIGLRYRSPRGWWIGAGLEDRVIEFDDDARDLSHTGDAGLFDLGYESPRFELRLALERRSLEPRGDSRFRDLELTTGLLETQWALHRSFDLYLYGRRQLGFSIRAESSDFVSERSGIRLDFALRDATLQIAAEAGEDDYESIAPGAPGRIDDVVAFATTLELRVREALFVRLGVTHTDYDSDADRFDRDVTAWTAVVELTGLREKLRLGDGQKIW